MNKNIEIFSKGLYSSWCYHHPSRTLFDCGEGFASYQGNYMYGVERVMISHGHGDHVLGLPSLIGCRNSGRGDREKPLEIYYPLGDTLAFNVQKFIEARNENLRYNVKWKGINQGKVTEISKTQWIQAFPMVHQRTPRVTLGYRILENRQKLLPEYEGKDIGALVRSGVSRDSLMQKYQHPVFVYALDAYHIEQEHLKDADMVVMDCTFLNAQDRDDPTHYTLHEAVDVCKTANVKKMVAAHFSPRYRYPEIRDAVAQYEGYVLPVYHNQVFEY